MVLLKGWKVEGCVERRCLKEKKRKEMNEILKGKGTGQWGGGIGLGWKMGMEVEGSGYGAVGL